MENVLITGLGAVTCHGGGRHALWSAMSGAAARAPDAVPDARGRMDLPLMHLVPDTDIPAAPQRLADAPLGRAPRMAVAAAREALADAGLEEGSSQPAVVIGTTMGDQGQREADGEPGTPVFLVASALGDALGLAGGHTSVSNACAASGYAISIAADMIRCGEADVVLAGGADAYSRVALACFNRMRAVDPVRCRPFDMHRSGTVFGEGAAMLVLESQTHARARGARAYARLAGEGWSCDAHHVTAPEPDGEQIVRAMRTALRRAGAAPHTVGCVIPHGTGTRLNDAVESRALNEVLGPRCRDVPVYSLKALIGHTGGAAGALAVCAAAQILRHGSVPANVPVDEQDPECEIWLPQDEAVPPSGRHALVNAYAFGGNNVSLLLEGVAA